MKTPHQILFLLVFLLILIHPSLTQAQSRELLKLSRQPMKALVLNSANKIFETVCTKQISRLEDFEEGDEGREPEIRDTSVFKNVHRLSLIIPSQEGFNLAIPLCKSVEELHLRVKLREEDFRFEVLEQLPQLRVLTIDFGDSDRPEKFFKGKVDLSFLRSLTNLEMFYTNWTGFVCNEEVIGDLKKLFYCRVSPLAFTPTLIEQYGHIKQLEFGDDPHLIFTVNDQKSAALFNSNLKPGMLLFYGTPYKTFLREMKRLPNDLPNGISSSINLRSEKGDTLFCLSSKGDSTFWSINSYYNGPISINGKYYQKQQYSWVQRNLISAVRGTYTSDSDNNWSLHAQTDNYERLISYQLNQLHGVQREIIGNYLNTEQNYDSGRLLYQYPFKGELPKELSIYPINLEHVRYRALGVYYNESGAFLLQSRTLPDSQYKVIIPLKNGKIHGTLIELNQKGDTTTSARFDEGILNGRYFRASGGHDMAIVRSYYINGELNGRSTIVNRETNRYMIFENGQMVFFEDRLNSNGALIAKIVWDPLKKQTELKYWSTKGKITLHQIFDADHKLIFEKKYPENLDPVPIDYDGGN